MFEHVIEEVRISALGVIDEAVLDLAPGFNVVTGETGAGKTMVVQSLGLLLGARGDGGVVRAGVGPGRRRGPAGRRSDRQVAARALRSGAELDERRRHAVAAASHRCLRRGAFARPLGGRRPRGRPDRALAGDSVAVHGQADQQRLLRPGRQRAALDALRR